MVTALESKPNACIQYDPIDDDYEVEDHTVSDSEDRKDIPDTEPVIRRSSRSRHPPDCYGVYVNLTEIEKELTTPTEALAGSDKDKWKSAMNAEFNSLKSNDVLGADCVPVRLQRYRQ
uniref:Reverse transcriptase Ty1/copia-type domain-containing protein n=1 Tax=Amphimedon queenslandica TaxID=400682 RepID=A0A1X7VQN0_AMPQE